MSAKSSYINNFAISIRDLNLVLDAKCTAPNIEKTEYNTPPVFDAHKVVDETYLFMPLGIAKDLTITLLQVISDSEKRSPIKFRLNGEKNEYWEAAVKAIEALREEKKNRQDSE